MEHAQRHRFRLVEFFIVVGAANTTQLRDGATVQGEAIDILPKPSTEEAVLLRDISMFCFPDGIKQHNKQEGARYFTFVLTDAVGARLYGFCLTFDESLRLLAQSQGKEQEMQGAVEGYVTKCLCIVTRRAYLRTFKRYLTTLYTAFRNNTFPPDIPIESYLANLVEIPLPPPGRIALSFALPGNQAFQIMAPGLLDFPLLDVPLHVLFECLDIYNVLRLLQCALLEKKILLHTKRPALLSLVAEGLCCIMWPFTWRRVYIPVLSCTLLEYTAAPTPFIMGVQSSFMGGLPPLKEVVFVDLDRNKIHIPDAIPDFPSEPKNRLVDALIDHVRPSLTDIDSVFSHTADDQEMHEEMIRAAFIVFYGELFGGFDFTTVGDTSEEQVFIDSRWADARDFYEQFFATEVWMSFAEDRHNDREDLFHHFLQQFYPARPKARPTSVYVLPEPGVNNLNASATTAKRTGKDHLDTHPSLNGKSRSDTSLIPSGRNARTSLDHSAPSNSVSPSSRVRNNSLENSGKDKQPTREDIERAEEERRLAQERIQKATAEQMEYLLSHFSKAESIFPLAPPTSIKPEDQPPGTPAPRTIVPEIDTDNRSNKERSAFLAAPMVAVKRAPFSGPALPEPPLFPRIRAEVFARVSGPNNLQDMIKRLAPLVEDSPEIIQYYWIRAALYAETQQYVLAVKDYERIWSLMYGFNRFIAGNEEIMIDLLRRLPKESLYNPEGLGEYPKSLIDQHLLPTSPRNKATERIERIDDEPLPSPRSPSPSRPVSVVTVISPAPNLYMLEAEEQYEGWDPTTWELKIDTEYMINTLPNEKVISQQQFEDYAANSQLASDWADAEKLWDGVARAGMNRVHSVKLARLVRLVQTHYSIMQNPAWTDLISFQHGEVVLKTSSGSVTNSSGQRGKLLLTNHRILFLATKLGNHEFCKLEDVAGVERYNYKILIPPGLPCIKVHTKRIKDDEAETEVFCFLSWVERDVWMSYLTELKGAYDVSAFLDSPVVIPLAAHRIVLTEVLSKLKKKHLRTLFRFLEMQGLRQHRIRQRLEGRGVLNTLHFWDSKSSRRHPCEVLEHLFETIIAQFYANLCQDGREVDLVQSPEFASFEKASAELQVVDLTVLTEEERMAFFINIFNMLTIHGYVIGGIPAQAVEWRYFCRAAMYNIGGNNYSLDDIYHGILRGNKAQPFLVHPPFTSADRRLPFVMRHPVAKVHFALSHHFASSPFLRLYRAPTLKQELDVATEEYLTANVILKPKEEEVILSELLRWYRSDFGPYDQEEHKPIIADCVLPYLSGSKQKTLQTMLQYAKLQVFYEFNWNPDPKPFRQL